MLVAKNDPQLRGQDRGEEVLYLPNGAALELVSFGYRNALANLLWFKTISYFGKHYASDRNYRWLAHQCELVTRLMPKAVSPYIFCSNMLSWEAGVPDQSVKILDRAVAEFPTEWNMRYYRGITYLVFLKQPIAALEDFRAASHLPDAPPLVKRLAAKTMAQLDDPAAAIEFLEQLIRGEADPNARKALQEKFEMLITKAGAK